MVIVTVQLPVAATVRQGFVVVNEPVLPATIENVIGVPAGAFANPAPEPSFTSKCAVKVCVVSTGFVPFGEIEIRASTNVLTAPGEFGAPVPVATVNGAEPATESVADAWPVTLPAVAELKTIVH